MVQLTTAWVVSRLGPARTILINATPTYPAWNLTAQAVALLRRVGAQPSAQLTQTHRRWWHAYYPQSFVALPDARLESFYWIQLYKLAAATRADRALIDNQGPWLQPTPWPYATWNLNVQLSYWPTYTSNHLGLSESLTRGLWQHRANLAHNVPLPYRAGTYDIGRATGTNLLAAIEAPNGQNAPEIGCLELGDGTTVSPRQLLGLELNPRAAAIADVVLRIGYLQWHLRTHGLTQLAEPLLDNYQNIRQQDAVLAADGPDFANPRPAAWPAADFIVGNPPFLGASRMREALGNGYTEALRRTYAGLVPESADLVMFWWQRAAAEVQAGRAERFGFITNSLRQTFNRRVMQPFLDGEQPSLALTFAIPDYPWVDNADGAAVRVAFTVADRASAQGTGQLLRVLTERAVADEDAAEVTFGSQEGRIQPDLSIGADLDTARLLQSNDGLSNPGVKLHGAGFIVSAEKAATLGLGTVSGLDNHIRIYRNGKDLTDKPRGVLVIDLFGLNAQEVITQFPAIYQHVFETVKPEHDQNKRAARRGNWWLFGETNPKKLFELAEFEYSPDISKRNPGVSVAQTSVVLF